METEHIFPADLSQLHPIIEWVLALIKPSGFDKPTLGKIELALEEAVMNIIHHGYKNQKGHIVIQIGQTKNHEVQITLKDQGPPFNPLEYSKGFDPLAPLEEREIGGLGIFLMRQYMDDIRYHREGSNNVLTLTKQIKKAS